MKKVLFIDGNSLFHRAYHAYEKSAMRDGKGGVWGVYGFVTLMLGIVDKLNPTHLIVGFDDPTGKSFRKEYDSNYKAQRSDKGEDFRAQADRLRSFLKELGISVMIFEGMEADDISGSMARLSKEEGFFLAIATSDRDALALVSETAFVYQLRNGLDNAVMYDKAKVIADYEVEPERYMAFAALRGDTSDNLPGVYGVGPKGASAILKRFTINELLTKAEAGEISDPKWVLESKNREIIRHNIKMMSPVLNLKVSIKEAALPLMVSEEIRKRVTEENLPSLESRIESVLFGVKTSKPTITLDLDQKMIEQIVFVDYIKL
jgi:5'-3' exonuclease